MYVDVQVASNSGSPIMLLPTSTMMMQPQPYVFLNPTDLQHVNIAPLMNSSSYFPAPTKLVPEVLTAGAGNGYFLVSPNQMLQVVSNAGTGMVPPSKQVYLKLSFKIVAGPPLCTLIHNVQ